MELRWRFRHLALLVFALLNGLDVLTTWYDIQHGAHEGNPLLAHLLLWAGFGGLILFKVLLVLVLSGGVLILVRLRAEFIAHLVLIVGLLFGLLWVLFNIVPVL